ncbi:MAG: hypothetical protein AMXMBFR66_08950 [Pseudomonadota bacterium]|nr:glycosyltransferase [Rubrivivax sp.]
MKIVYFDPGLAGRGGHNSAMLAEFEQALVQQGGNQVTVLAAARLAPAAFAGSALRFVPLFEIEGYQTFDSAALASGHALAAVGSALERADDLLACADAVLMPTAYPLHVQALGRCAARLAGRRVVLALMLPASYWAQDALAVPALDAAFAEGLGALAGHCELFAYSETGGFDLGGERLRLPTLLPPVAAPTMALLRGLATSPRAAAADRPPVIGFFGSAFGSKGFERLAAAVRSQLADGRVPRCRLRLALPPQQRHLARAVALAPWVEVVDVGTSNEDYLRAMAAVDAVWTFYDPGHYGQKMSGIVPEALALGKPLLVAEGCQGIVDFLEHHAPGSYVVGPYDARTARALLDLDPATLARAGQCARQHAPIARSLKDMERYLAVCGLLGAERAVPPAPAEAPAPQVA